MVERDFSETTGRTLLVTSSAAPDLDDEERDGAGSDG